MLFVRPNKSFNSQQHLKQLLIIYFYTRNKFDDADASFVLEFMFNKQMEIKAHLYKIVENFTNYQFLMMIY